MHKIVIIIKMWVLGNVQYVVHVSLGSFIVVMSEILLPVHVCWWLEWGIRSVVFVWRGCCVCTCALCHLAFGACVAASARLSVCVDIYGLIMKVWREREERRWFISAVISLLSSLFPNFSAFHLAPLLPSAYLIICLKFPRLFVYMSIFKCF